MKPGKLRPIAICLIIQNEQILVQKGFDRIKEEEFYRPLGGKIKFGELGAETIKRELYEEIKVGLKNIKYLGTLENIFTYNGLKGHEIVLIYKAESDNLELFVQPVIRGYESDGEPIEAIWVPLENFTECPNKNQSKYIPIYPKGIIELIQKNL